jgi:hypothetical protein
LVKRFLRFAAIGLAGVCGVAYAVDWGMVAFPGNRTVYEDVVVDQVYTDTNRWHEVEYSRGAPITETCVWSLFPHGGHTPCWYLKKHTMRTTNTD